MKICFSLFLYLASSTFIYGQCNINVDFNNWVVAEAPCPSCSTPGNWQVLNASSVRQNVNSNLPTFFVSPFDLINVEITGQIRCDDDEDDDWLGVALGFQGPFGNTTYDHWLFDWKRTAQTGCGFTRPRGQSLCRADGTFPSSTACGTPLDKAYFEHSNVANPYFNVVANNFGGPGWARSQWYTFRAVYTFTTLEIYIDNVLRFSIQDCFEPGRFGFYNLSQSNVTYRNFSYTPRIDFQVLTPTVCTGESANFEFIDLTCNPGFNYSLISSLVWDWGDGTQTTNNAPNASNINPTHIYSVPGTYNVTLTLTDNNGCTDSEVNTITVNSTPSVTFLANDACIGSPVSFANTTTGNSGSTTWQWNFGNGQTSTAQTPPQQTYATAGSYTVTLSANNLGCIGNTSATIDVLPNLSSSGVVTDASCQVATNGSIDLTMNNGTPPYSYLWSNGAITQDLAGIGEDTYDVTISDNNGCTGTNSFTVNFGPGLTGIIAPTDAACQTASNGAANLTVNTGTSPFQYVWSNNATTEDITSISPGNYSVTYTDANGCTGTNSTIINFGAQLTGNATTVDASCTGVSNGSVDLTVLNGTAPFNYSWSNSTGTEDLAGVPSGSYSVTFTDANNCTGTVAAQVGAGPSPSGLVTTQNAACSTASTGSATVSITGGQNPFIFQWSNGLTTQTISNQLPGTYTVTFTDINGCSGTATGVIGADPNPSLSFLTTDNNGYSVSCPGLSDAETETIVTGAIAPYQFTWSDNSTSQVLQNVGAGTYSVTMTDINNCQATGIVTLTSPPPLSIVLTSTDFNGFDISCFGSGDGSINATANGGVGGYLYDWGNQQGASISNLTAGTYTVTVTDANGCTTSDNILLNEPPSLEISLTGNEPTCFGYADGSVSATGIGGVAPLSYIWSNGSTSSSITGIVAGNYIVTITDANACSISMNMEVSQPEQIFVTIEPIMDTIQFFGDSIELLTTFIGNTTLPTSWEWIPTDYLSCFDCPSPFAYPPATTEYVVLLTDDEGCMDKDTIKVFVNNDKILFIPSAFSPNGDNTNDKFEIFTYGVKHFELTIHNRWGEQLFESNDINNQWDGFYNGKLVPADVYIYQVSVTYLDGDRLNRKGSLTRIR